MMGGKLSVNSTPGEGSMFCLQVDLPGVEAPAPPPQPDTPAVIGFKGSKRKVLVVDDKTENRLLLVNLLVPLGFEVWEAASGQEALTQAHLVRPDLILMDIVMPAMDGLEATRRFRQLSAFSETIIIAVSASTFNQDKQRSLAAGCNEFISKPIKIETLLQQLQKHLKLEWVYEQPTSDSAGQAAASPSMIGPPAEQAALLLELAMKGDITGIKQQAAQLGQLDEKYGPFVRELQQLAQRYRIKQIRQMLTLYKNGGNYE